MTRMTQNSKTRSAPRTVWAREYALWYKSEGLSFEQAYWLIFGRKPRTLAEIS